MSPPLACIRIYLLWGHRGDPDRCTKLSGTPRTTPEPQAPTWAPVHQLAICFSFLGRQRGRIKGRYDVNSGSISPTLTDTNISGELLLFLCRVYENLVSMGKGMNVVGVPSKNSLSLDPQVKAQIKKRMGMCPLVRSLPLCLD
jgi:hypothetical protein